jgi:hypothetical protein
LMIPIIKKKKIKNKKRGQKCQIILKVVKRKQRKQRGLAGWGPRHRCVNRFLPH